jgi:hypothetical protein
MVRFGSVSGLRFDSAHRAIGRAGCGLAPLTARSVSGLSAVEARITVNFFLEIT